MTVVSTIDLGGGRTTRVFVRSADHLPLAESSAAASFMDEGDRQREPALREVLGNAIVFVDAHAGVEPADAQHVFVRRQEDPDGPRIFACVIATLARVEEMLRSEPCVFEAFSFQVSSGRIVTPAGTLAAFETWFERVFPDMALPAMCFAGISESVDRLAESDVSDVRGESDAQLPTEFDDVASLVAA